MENIISGPDYGRGSYVVFFDLDLTLIRSVSGRELAKGAYKSGLLSSSDLLRALLLSVAFRLKLKDPLTVIDKMVAWVKGIPEEPFTKFCIEISDKILIPSVYSEALTEIAFHRSNNARLVILSSALDPVCKRVAQKLNLDDQLCSSLEAENGSLTGRPAGPLCFGQQKAVRLAAYCLENHYSTSDAWFYTDSISDITALKAVGNPVCINPDKALKRAALKEDWKILSWNINSPQAAANQAT